MNSKNFKTKAASAVPGFQSADHFPDVRKMVESNTGNPVEFDGFRILSAKVAGASNSRRWQREMREQDAPATLKPIEFERFRILSTLETRS